VNSGMTVVVSGVFNSDRGVTVVVCGVLTSDRWYDSSGMWCTY
jgi:hypothetical protein